MTRGHQITLIIHGTFAREASWWRLGNAESPTFANKLEAKLAEQGLEGTVWSPALASGMDYSEFDWTGINRHADRRAGARKLARSLKTLASKLGCSNQNPLTVNLVAHSHGGSVALELLRQVPRSVAIGEVVLLGTPLVAQCPVFRPARLVLGFFLTLMLLVLYASPVFYFFDPAKYPIPVGLGELFAWIVFLTVIYGWLFVALSATFDEITKGVVNLVRGVLGRAHGQLYGPSPRTIRRILDDRKIVLFTSTEDEPSLGLQLAAAPQQLYLDHVRTNVKGIAKILEFCFVRPIFTGLILRIAEMVLEKVSFGVSWIGVCFRDYRMVDLGNDRAYPASVLSTLDVTGDILPVLHERQSIVAPPIAMATDGGHRESNTLLQSLINLKDSIKDQIQLRHSMYYESEQVIARVAGVITGTGTPQETRVPDRSATLR